MEKKSSKEKCACCGHLVVDPCTTPKQAEKCVLKPKPKKVR